MNVFQILLFQYLPPFLGEWFLRHYLFILPEQGPQDQTDKNDLQSKELIKSMKCHRWLRRREVFTVCGFDQGYMIIGWASFKKGDCCKDVKISHGLELETGMLRQPLAHLAGWAYGSPLSNPVCASPSSSQDIMFFLLGGYYPELQPASECAFLPMPSAQPWFCLSFPPASHRLRCKYPNSKFQQEEWDGCSLDQEQSHQARSYRHDHLRRGFIMREVPEEKDVGYIV